MGDSSPSAGKLQGFAQAALQYVRARLDLLQYEMRQEQRRVQRRVTNTPARTVRMIPHRPGAA